MGKWLPGHEGYSRSLNFVKDWLAYADPETGLIPGNLGDKPGYLECQRRCSWTIYPFMVMTAALLDSDLYQGQMKQILETEIRGNE